jgi:hypothetical protein
VAKDMKAETKIAEIKMAARSNVHARVGATHACTDWLEKNVYSSCYHSFILVHVTTSDSLPGQVRDADSPEVHQGWTNECAMRWCPLLAVRADIRKDTQTG